jgi:hypothetical protein
LFATPLCPASALTFRTAFSSFSVTCTCSRQR